MPIYMYVKEKLFSCTVFDMSMKELTRRIGMVFECCLSILAIKLSTTLVSFWTSSSTCEH